MSQIRRQSIIATLVIFVGFFIGFLNNLLFTNKTWFAENEYSITNVINNFGQIIFAFSTLGINALVYKFFPYYKAHVKDEENDLIGLSILISSLFFVVVAIVGYFCYPIFEKKNIEKSPEILQYYFWLFPYAYFLILFSILESYCWCIKKSILSNFLKEVNLRLMSMILILLFIFKVINIETLLKAYSCLYFINVVIIIVTLSIQKKIRFVFTPSKVSKRFLKKMVLFSALIYGGTAISTLASFFDSLTISSKVNQVAFAVFSIATYISNIIQIPQRSITAIAIPELAAAWREKKLDKIQRIYSRSSINLLLASLFLYCIILLSFSDAIIFLGMKPTYLEGKAVFILLGLKLIIDMGTGVNGQIIGTSNYWKFEFGTGVILLALIIPLNYYLISNYGIIGAGIANLIAYTIYNIIRLLFLWKKFKMQPFSSNTGLAIIYALFSFGVVYFCFQQAHGFWGILLKSLGFSAIFLPLVYYTKLSPDVQPVLNTIKKRLDNLKK